MEKKTKKKEKAEPLESLSQGKDQFEGEPRAVKQIIGQQGDKSKMRKLMNWLRDWEKNRKKPASKCEYTCI